MTRHQKRMRKQAIQQVGLHILFIVICFVTLIPILYALSVSLNADNSLVSSDFRFIPKNFTLRNYVAVFTEEPVMLWFKNSMTLAVVTVLISLTASIPAAYAFSRMHFKGRKPILKQLVLLYSFPSVLSMFAIYTLLRPLGLINSKVGLILIYTGTMAEFALLNMKGYFDTIPREIEEAAEIDGCGEVRRFVTIVLPLVQPALITLTIFTFNGAWNNFLWPLIINTRSSMHVLTITMATLSSNQTTNYGMVMAGATLTFVFPFLLYVFLQKQFVEGVAMGGVKG